MTQDALFQLPPRRKANANPSRRADEITIPLVLRRSERQALHVYDSKGGAQDLVRDLIEMMDSHPMTGNGRWCLDLDKDTTWRLVRTILTSKKGGPNDALRTAFHRYFGTGEGW